MPEAVREGPASDGPLGPVLILLPTPPPTLLLVLKALRALRMTKAPTVLIVLCVASAVCVRLWVGEGREEVFRWILSRSGSHAALQPAPGCGHDEEEDEEHLLVVVVMLLVVDNAVERSCH